MLILGEAGLICIWELYTIFANLLVNLKVLQKKPFMFRIVKIFQIW